MTKQEEVTSGVAQLLDVRTPEEWNQSHAEYAIHVPVENLLKGELGLLSPDKRIYVYCLSGGRAGLATTYLHSKGYHAENIGSLSSWLQSFKHLA
jgi:rhodanese-related sulfurtransferase